MTQCVYCQAGLCDEASINKGNSDAACHRMNNRKVLVMLQKVERGLSAPIMTVLNGRVTTNVAMLPHALRTNRPTRAEAEVAAEVIERLYAELQAARCDARPDASDDDTAANRIVKAIAEADMTLRADAAEWLREDATSAREHDPNAGIHAKRDLADLLDAIAGLLEQPGSAQLAPDPAVVSKDDLEALSYVEDLVRGSGFADRADRLAYLHGVLERVAQGREAWHYRESYDRAVQRLVRMRELIPAEVLRSFEVEWRTRKAEPLTCAAVLNLPEVVRGELRQMAEHCGAVSYSPPPTRAVRGVSLTFEQLEALAVLISGAVWPVPGGESR